MPPFDTLRAYLEPKAAFSDEDFALMKRLFRPATLRSGDFLQRAGEVPTHAAFVASGCLRTYVIDAKGREHIVQFASTNWWAGDTPSAVAGTPSLYFIDAIEESAVLLIDPPSHQQLVDRVPGYAASYRAGLQRHVAAKNERIVSSLSASAEERYLEFMTTYPTIAERVPQWMLASYLGVSPETVSRIRRNLSRK